MVGFAIAVDQPQTAEGIDVFLLYPWGLCKAVLAGIVVNGRQGIVSKGIGLYPAERAVCSDVVVVGAVEVEVLTDGDEVLVLLGAVVAHRVTGVVGFLSANDPRLVPVIDREVGVFGGGCQAVIDYGCWIEDFIHPVGIGRQFVAHVGETQHVECRGLVAVGKLFPDEHDVILRTKHLGKLPRLRIQVARLVANGSFVLAAAVLGGDDDDPVCCTGTVDGAGGCILQYIDGLDVGGVDVIDVAELQSVYDEKWRVITVRANTANEDGLASTGLSTRFINKQTGRLAFQRRNDIRHGNALDVFRSDFGNRAG